jgi:hypothetical protein
MFPVDPCGSLWHKPQGAQKRGKIGKVLRFWHAWRHMQHLKQHPKAHQSPDAVHRRIPQDTPGLQHELSQATPGQNDKENGQPTAKKHLPGTSGTAQIVYSVFTICSHNVFTLLQNVTNSFANSLRDVTWQAACKSVRTCLRSENYSEYL